MPEAGTHTFTFACLSTSAQLDCLQSSAALHSDNLGNRRFSTLSENISVAQVVFSQTLVRIWELSGEFFTFWPSHLKLKSPRPHRMIQQVGSL
jgi:hypothetical protein